MELARKLESVEYVKRFQEFCGVINRVSERPESSYRSPDWSERSKHKRINAHCPTGTWVNENNNNDIKHQLHKNETMDNYSLKSSSNTSDEDPPYVIKYKSLFYLAKVAAFLGDELFYLIFFPFWLWNIDSVIGRRTFFIWCLVMYLGQATKDYLRWPRPSSPPVHRLESTHLQEYAMPSTHAMASTAIPLALFIMLYDRYEFPILAAVAIAVTWCVMVCLSRLYLGVHTVLDILCGIAYSVGVVFFVLPYIRDFDHFQQTHPLAPVVLFGVGLAMCTVCYPSKDQNSAKGDAVQIVSVAMGCGFGFWLNYHSGLSSTQDVQLPYTMTGPSLKWLALSLLRFTTGAIIGGIVREVVKRVAIKWFSYFFGLEKPDKSNPAVQTAYKFVSYYCLGATVLFAIPYFHKIIGINRVEFYYEIN